MAKTPFGKISVKAFDFELGSLAGVKTEDGNAELGASVASLRSIYTGRAIENTPI